MKRIIDSQAHTALMQFLFNQVCDQDDWKKPVHAIVPYDAVNVYMQAIEFMTGVKVEYKFLEPSMVPPEVPRYEAVELTCAGYYAGPCN